VNRFHQELTESKPADIPPVATVQEDQLFRVETIDWTGGQVKDNDSADDIKFVDLSQVHYLSGPIRCEDGAGKPAMPGDLLLVEICEVVASTDRDFGLLRCLRAKRLPVIISHTMPHTAHLFFHLCKLNFFLFSILSHITCSWALFQEMSGDLLEHSTGTTGVAS